METRLDKFMVEAGLVKTRSQSSMLIKQGDVSVNGKVILKSSHLVEEGVDIKISSGILYVSRGAHKLIAAINEFNLDFKDKVIADCGASTGGFTQVSLNNGASKVYAIDVGHDQLSPLLLDDEKVVNLEGINLKNEYSLPEKVDFCVADLSFISIKLVYPTMASMLKDGGKAVVLIKPQFEAGKKRLGKGGIVKDQYQEIIKDEVLRWFAENDHKVERVIDSPIKGKTGNREYLALIS
jgi:23S rRNA (cytidine1920-2'-O)/16S rRNA (cytidine1409-2'-O)-methyltransferase